MSTINGMNPRASFGFNSAACSAVKSDYFTNSEFWILQEELLHRPTVIRDLSRRNINVLSYEAVVFYYNHYLTTMHNPDHPDNAHLIRYGTVTKIFLRENRPSEVKILPV
jgi:hypothetical protein